jgi:hypothetical protein
MLGRDPRVKTSLSLPGATRSSFWGPSSVDEIRRVRKIDERKPIDAVPAMALALWRATQAETSDIPLAAFV